MILPPSFESESKILPLLMKFDLQFHLLISDIRKINGKFQLYPIVNSPHPTTQPTITKTQDF